MTLSPLLFFALQFAKVWNACQTLQSVDHPDFSRDGNIINTFKVFGISEINNS